MQQNKYYRALDNAFWGFEYELTEAQILLYLQGQTEFFYEKKINVPKTQQITLENGETTEVIIKNEFEVQTEQIPNNGVFIENFVSHPVEKVADWTSFKNTIFDNQTLFMKCFSATAYNLVSGMIISAEAGQKVLESNFLLALNMLKNELISKGNALTQNEIDFINQTLIDCQFSIQL